jgi:hypothetical protein
MARRSARNAGKTMDYSDFNSASLFPEGPPTNGIERAFHALSLEAFPSSQYARVDDILVHALFSTKRRPHGYRALHPTTAGNDTGLTNDNADAISQIIMSDIDREHPTKEECKVAAMNILIQFHEFFIEGDLPIIQQYVINFHSPHERLVDGFSQPSTTLCFTPLNPQFDQDLQSGFWRPN